MSVAVVVLTFNRLPKLRLCVENVLARASDEVTEIVIWNNGSTDGTTDYLAALDRPGLTVVQSETNVGMVAYGRAFALTTAPYLVQLDDDVIDAPDGWDTVLLDACRRLPEFGYLAADVEDDPTDRLSSERHRVHRYVERRIDGIDLLEGPTGGWCTITSRVTYEAVGGLPVRSRQTYFSTDTVYVRKLERGGYRRAIVTGVRVRHSGDRQGAAWSPEKAKFHAREARIDEIKSAVRRAALALPGGRALNRRLGLFDDPRRTG